MHSIMELKSKESMTPINDSKHEPKEDAHYHSGKNDKRRVVYKHGINSIMTITMGRMVIREEGCDELKHYFMDF